MLWQISLLIVSVALVIIAIFLAPTLLQIRRTGRKIEQVADNLNAELPEILENFDEISSHLAGILYQARENVEILGDAATEIKEMVDEAANFQKNFKKKVEEPLVESLVTLSAVSRGVRTFFAVLAHPENNRPD